MGNMLLRGFVHRNDRRIKIMRTDGTVMKLRSPVSVKEILVDYPGHRIFDASVSPRPLSERAGLVCGHLYYLIPLPFRQDDLINDNNNRKTGPFARASFDHSIPSASSRLQPESCADIGRGSVKQEKADSAVNKINRGGVRIVSSSYSTDGSAVRVKLRIRKEDLASFLSALTQGATRQSPWRPRLDTIAEPHSPVGDL